MNRLPHIAIFFAAALLVAAEKKPAKATASSPKQVQQWIQQLGDDDFKVREEATRDLIKAGGIALDAVAKATKSKDAEVRQRALMIIKRIKQLEKAAIAYFEKLGGQITVDEKSSGKPVIKISLKGSKVTDAGLVHLKELPNLQRLSLNDTKVTDAGLVHLKGLTNLQELELKGTKITRAGYEKLQKALPKCGILFQTEAEKAAIAYIKKLGGQITVDEKDPDKPVIGLDLSHTKVTDAGLEHLKELGKLQELSLFNTKITDAGLVHLKGLTKLQRLDLFGTKITDAGLVHLSGLTNLRTLDFNATKVTRAGYEKLKKELPKCGVEFQAEAAKVAIAYFKKLGGDIKVDENANLQELYLWNTKVTDAGLVHLKGLAKLQTLHLYDTKVTDAGLVHLKGLTNLRFLALQKTGVTDAGLVHLKGLTKLRVLALGNTKVTEAGIEKLKEALPNCTIFWPAF